MARPPRFQVAGGTFHVTAQGTGPCDIYRDDADRHTFLSIFDAVVGRFGWQVVAYCLMDTHYHAVFETPLADLARGMQRLNTLYAISFNRRHERVGALFRGRYASRFIQTEEHLVNALAYVANNPVQAGLCTHASEWPWSRYPAGADAGA